jgi:hypothetical protein
MTPVTSTPAPIVLRRGGHNASDRLYCFNEAIAYAAGEPHSSYPSCASPVIRRFGMVLNDRLDDERRQLLRPFVLRAIGTAGDGRDQERRAMCIEFLVEHLPDLFERAGLPDTARRLREQLPNGLAEENVLRILREARDDAYSARSAAYERLRVRVAEEVRKHGLGNEDDAEVSVAVEVEVEVEVAAVAAVAVAAVAAAVAAEVAEAEVAEVAEAAVAAVAEVAEAEVAVGSSRYWAIRKAVYAKVYPIVKAKLDEVYGSRLDEMLPKGLDLFDRMLPADPVQLPVIENADVLFAAPEQRAA